MNDSEISIENILNVVNGNVDTRKKTFLLANFILDLILICKLKSINNYRQVCSTSMWNCGVELRCGTAVWNCGKMFLKADCTEK